MEYVIYSAIFAVLALIVFKIVEVIFNKKADALEVQNDLVSKELNLFTSSENKAALTKKNIESVEWETKSVTANNLVVVSLAVFNELKNLIQSEKSKIAPLQAEYNRLGILAQPIIEHHRSIEQALFLKKEAARKLKEEEERKARRKREDEESSRRRSSYSSSSSNDSSSSSSSSWSGGGGDSSGGGSSGSW